MTDAWTSIQLSEIEPIPVVNDTLLWRPVRRALDIGAFGINSYVAHSAGDDVVEEHTESALGHEEVYVVLSGRATFILDGEVLDASAGTVVFIRDVNVKRRAGAEEDGTSVLAIGGPRESRYEPSAWEDAIGGPRTTRRISPSSPPRSSVVPITPARSTTSPVPKRSQACPTKQSRISAARSNCVRSSPSTHEPTRTSRRCASGRTGPSSSA